MRNRLSVLALLLPCLLSAACPAGPSDSSREAAADLPPDLVAKASVDIDAARRTALEQVEGASVVQEELEEEGGRLIYTFELATPGRTGVDEVNVDARDGSLISVEHESPVQEREERALEAQGTP